MNRVILSIIAVITGFFALAFSLLMAIPLTIAALITGKRIQKQMRQNGQFYAAHQTAGYGAAQDTANSGATIEGEFEEVKNR